MIDETTESESKSELELQENTGYKLKKILDKGNNSNKDEQNIK